MTGPVVVGVGSNIDPEHHVATALEDLRAQGLELEVSPWYRSPAIGLGEGAGDFINLAALFPWPRPLADLKALLRRVEEAHGRTRLPSGRWISRTLDLDLLVARNLIDPAMRLPHPDLGRFAHVAVPVADLIGSHTHPQLGCTYAQLAARLDASVLKRIEVAL
ncbi:2-amino-4-hydroxy-6-hydroxymethyldihydropteridine diphosphokinase [Nocardiopsis metallicus]|uniref:2-amino-4-hydroxy-6-hydroxymethyldihydropteridine diphosphokinase n=1 Tax=Nocardiopsis metallicus TaxID=179819 RepID=A0A840WJU2_9ACTN|nr:2-amino-4-hydroxy-6-hydroxymethyldihydropteridine diphosphokinase [Nocardiopsis metallicus]MBB5491947.1 2-amino-4-hydroxy-6-hydroxymethyldihydropteridine diphosphokinase [Nocardiopsis metallicus]